MVNNQNFLIGEVPILHPITEEYQTFWDTQYEYCINGYWSGGKWMPPNLYFYVNFWHILLNKSKHSKSKSLGKPLLRDLEWEFFYVWMEARGFSRFSNQSLHDIFEVDEYGNFIVDLLNTNYNNYVYKKGCTPRELLRKVYITEQGTPFFENQAQNVLMLGSRGFGKALKNDSKLYTNNGEVCIGDVKLGDEIYGADGKLTKVTGIYPQGKVDIYKITLRDGRELYCCENHQWSIIRNNKEEVVRLKDIKNNYFNWRINSKSINRERIKEFYYAIPKASAINYPYIELVIDPYFLGLWLGDGNSNKIGISTEDKEIKDYIYKIASDNKMQVNINENKCKTCPTYLITNGQTGGKPNLLLNTFRNSNLILNKHIPKAYFRSTISQRMSLLQGLMDTDGSCDKNGSIEFTSSDKALAYDVLKLCRSLGINSRIIKRSTTHKDNYRVSLYTNLPVFRLKRKLRNMDVSPCLNRLSKINKTFIINIELVKQDLATCIEVNNENHLFLTDEYTPTHNSYTVAGGVIAHELIFNKTTEVLIGAYDSSFSADTLTKVKRGLENFEGGCNFSGISYPAPFYQETHGSWDTGKEPIEFFYWANTGSGWERQGTLNNLYHRSFRDKPTGANGTRPAIIIKEEVGLWPGLLKTFGPCKECTMDGAVKFGSELYIGTGGDMDKGTVDVQKMFYEPETYDMVVFEDRWENAGKICYFVPATMGLNQYKDENGYTDEVAADAYLDRVREKLKNSKSTVAIDEEVQNRPKVPSEMFLTKSGNIFPRIKLMDQRTYIETNRAAKNFGTRGMMKRNIGSNKIEFKPNPSLIPCDYPVNAKDKGEGCVIIYDYPSMEEEIPYGLYIAGIDPYDFDESTTTSLGAIYVYKRFKRMGETYNMIVAEYVGRPETADDFYEQCRLLLEYYNATALYENEKIGIYTYFKQKNCTHLLVDQPDIIHQIIKDSKVNRGKGIHMVIQIKQQAEIYVRDWLNTEYDTGKCNINKIFSSPLLKELIGYNREGNFDRVIALMLVILYDIELYHLFNKEAEQQQQIDEVLYQDDFFDKSLF